MAAENGKVVIQCVVRRDGSTDGRYLATDLSGAALNALEERRSWEQQGPAAEQVTFGVTVHAA